MGKILAKSSLFIDLYLNQKFSVLKLFVSGLLESNFMFFKIKKLTGINDDGGGSLRV